MRKAIPVEQRVAITLRFLSTNADSHSGFYQQMQTVDHWAPLWCVQDFYLFCNEASVCSHIQEVIAEVYNIPSSDGLTEVAE